MPELPIEITLRHDSLAPQTEEKIRERINKLSKYEDGLLFCHVVIDSPQQHQQSGKMYRVNIKVGLPGTELVVNHNTGPNFQTVLSEAFENIKRQLETHHSKMHDHHHAESTTPILGHVLRLFPEENYGFIGDGVGEEYYFNENQLVNLKFKQLEVKQAVHFIPKVTDQGTQAHHITACKEHGTS